MKTIILFISILIFPANIAAQEKCELSLSEAPTLQNLKLGMTSAEANKALGRNLKVKVKPDGQRTFFQNYIKKSAKGSVQGIRAIFLRFYNDKLYQIELFYEEDYRWRNLENLLDEYSVQNNFPREFWQTEYGYATANCKGFSLKADYKLNPHIQLTNDAIAEKIEIEREEKKNKTEN